MPCWSSALLGAGKTTLLRFLALTFARRQAPGAARAGGGAAAALRDPARLQPFSGGRVATDRRSRSISYPDVLPCFLTCADAEDRPASVIYPDNFLPRIAWRTAECVVLLDGLDEVADPRTGGRSVAEAVAILHAAITRGNRFVVTSRPRGYEGVGAAPARLRSTPVVRSATFDDADMTAFAQNWYAAVIA